MAVAAFLLVLAGAVLSGSSLGRLMAGPEDRWTLRFAMWLAAGLVVLHVVLAWLDLAGVPWHPLMVAALVAAGALACRRALGRAPAAIAPEAIAAAAAGRRRRPRLDWATLTGAATVGFFAILAASQRIAFPDFVYHWGIKGHRYFLARGIDYDFLGRDWNLVAHRDYPQLVPELYAFQSLAARRFSEPALLLWSAVLFAMLLVAARAALEVWAVREGLARVAFVVLAIAVATFAVGHQMAGSADWIVAFALTAALPALSRRPSARSDLQLGVLAALAAASKLEGIPLAGLLVVTGVGRRIQQALATRRGAAGAAVDRGAASRSIAGGAAPGNEPAASGVLTVLAAALRLAGPSILAVTPWLVQGLRHDLFRDPQSGPFDAGRAAAIAAAVWQSMLRAEWHLVPLVLLLLPLLFLRRETRLAGTIVALLLGGYLLRYFTASFDYEFSVLSSFPRLMFQVIPAVLVGLAVVADRWTTRRAGTGSGRSARSSRCRRGSSRSGSAAS